MNQETHFILDALKNNPNGLDKHEIRKWIRNHYDHKITATKIKNYLWSYLKDEVNQNSEDFTYSLKVLPVKSMTIVVEQRQQAGGVPGGAGCQFLALKQHHIRPAFFGQVVERRYPHHATADDYRPRIGLHALTPLDRSPAELCSQAGYDP